MTYQVKPYDQAVNKALFAEKRYTRPAAQPAPRPEPEGERYGLTTQIDNEDPRTVQSWLTDNMLDGAESRYVQEANRYGGRGYNVAAPEAHTREVERDELAGHRLGLMLSSDSPLMRRAAQQGKDFAASRGLMNSSIAAGNAQGAMIDRATPLALDESRAYQTAAGQNLGARNTAELTRAQLDAQMEGLEAQRDAQFRGHFLGGAEDIRRALFNIENREDSQRFAKEEREGQQDFNWKLAELDAELKREGIAAGDRQAYLQAWAMVETGRANSLGQAFAMIAQNPNLEAKDFPKAWENARSILNPVFDQIVGQLPPMPDFNFGP